MPVIRRVSLLLMFAMLAVRPAGAAPVAVVAAEDFYGGMAAAIGGERVSVTSVLTNPDQDPHSFEATPATARLIADAALVIFNGAGYDPWMPKLLAASPSPRRKVVDVGRLAGRKPGDNPHLWYDPAIMRSAAMAVAAALTEADPESADAYQSGLRAYLEALGAVEARVATIKARFAGTEVTAVEPVFGLMAQALGLAMRNERFQLSVMNETEPRAGDIAGFESDLKSRRVKVVFHNSQSIDPLSGRLLDLARRSGVAVVGVTETMPEGKNYAAWMLDQLAELELALASGAR